MADEIDLPAPVRWVRVPWDEPDLVGELVEGLDSSCMEFLYELGTDGTVLRAIELTGSDRLPIAAASLAEFWAAQEHRQQPATAALLQLESVYGGVPEGSAHEWLRDAPVVDMTGEVFEAEWTRSRAHLAARPRSAHFAAC